MGVIMGQREVSSEHRRSSCSSFSFTHWRLRPEQKAAILLTSLKVFFVKKTCKTYLDQISKFVCDSPIENMSALVQVMAWCLTGTKPLPEPMMTNIPCDITRPQWVDDGIGIGHLPSYHHFLISNIEERYWVTNPYRITILIEICS